VITSNNVDLPAPVGPMIANNPASESGGTVKSKKCSPLSEWIFLNLSLSTFKVQNLLY
jgi:hypothetical protein